ncbi:CHAP domain-containing protein [Gemella haemolysans]|uniref:CHAP domain-containing protein n=1 Tax=Gemella haemolysans TaxID=1379 RepID=UPI00290C3248|nr:CHAP domain-containing protein [Gemella haemolysans]MDU3832382.1 CHAP domain-containing protein [Gemella haemolysans]
MKKNKLKFGLGILTVLATPIAVNTVVGTEVHAAQGWVQNGSSWYFYNNQGNAVRNAWQGNYWLGADGKMATNTWVDGGRYYVGSDGLWVKGAQKATEVNKQGWVQNGSSWYYYYQGNIVRNAWIGNYWLGADGRMATDAWVDNGRYYVGSNGEWVKGAQRQVETKKHGWIESGTSWYYLDSQGNVVRNAWVGNYWLGADGEMATNSWVDNDRYYVGANGVWEKDKKREERKRGWKKENNVWYYYNEDGSLARNKWAGNYWLGADGKMVTNAWVDNDRYYVGSNGAWIQDKKKEDSSLTGKHTGWVKSGSTWYYFDAQGQMIRNAWAGNYWLEADGRMATNKWVANNRYYVGSNGAWVQNPDNNTNLNKVLDIARSYLGVETDSATHKKIVDAYNSVDPKPVGYTATYDDDWCDIFVTTVFQQAGLSDLIGRECGVQRHIGIMEKKGIWKGKSQPKVGDIVTFDWDGGGFADHIGIVESVNNGVITTIEGNSALYAGSTAKTKVNRKTYNWNSNYIKGYARPAY